MDTRRLTNPVVKAAFEAWQGKDLAGWLSHFAPGAKLYDDGNPCDLMRFSKEIGKERFTSIDAVENNGKSIFGQFHSDTWGDFRTYFKFELDDRGKIVRLDIGQV